MKAINVEIKGIRVSSFSPGKKEVSFLIEFNDGKDKEITKNVRLDDESEVHINMIKDIRKVENSLHAEFDGKSVLEDYIRIIIKDEEKVTEKMKHFVTKVFEKVNVIKNQTVADGYMGLINQVNSMRIEF